MLWAITNSNEPTFVDAAKTAWFHCWQGIFLSRCTIALCVGKGRGCFQYRLEREPVCNHRGARLQRRQSAASAHARAADREEDSGLEQEQLRARKARSEEHTSELQSLRHLVC